MRVVSRNTFLMAAITVAAAIAANHHELNGTWVLVPERCNFGSQPAIQSGNVTIWDREHNITVSRTFDIQGAGGVTSYTVGIDGGEGSTIHDGKTVKYKARWDGSTLVVTTTVDKIPAVERYSLAPDGLLAASVSNPGGPPMTLVFRRE
ncbi:MAG: hypothetical protein ABSH50_18385 [Bryobacteraceae bacterium]|jgi:hypothetical protein